VIFLGELAEMKFAAPSQQTRAKLNGDLVGHLPDARGKEKRLEAWASANGATRSEAFRLHGAYGDGRRSSVQEDRH